MTDHDEIGAFEQATRTRRLRIVLAAVAFEVVVVWVGSTIYHRRASGVDHAAPSALSDRERDEYAQLIPEARRRLGQAIIAWKAVVLPPALGVIVPGPTPCQHELRAPTARAAATYIKFGRTDGNDFGNVSYETYVPGASLEPRRLVRGLAAIERLAGELDGAAGPRELDELRRVADLGDELVVVANQTTPVIELGADGLTVNYTAGTVIGYAYMYSHRLRQVRCVAALDVQSSPTIDIEYSHQRDDLADRDAQARAAAQAKLGADLEVNVIRAIVRDLRAVDAPPPAL